MDIELIGAGFNSAGIDSGVARAPRALRSAALVEGLRKQHRVTDSGDVRFSSPSPVRSPESGLLAADSLVSMIAGVDRAIAAAWTQSRVPLLLGGDCPVLIGALAAGRAAFGDIGLLFVDGHEDAWPPKTSPTGEAADSELGFALGVTTAALPRELAAILPLLRLEATAMLGPRDAEELAQFSVPSLRDSVWFRSGGELTGRIERDSALALNHVVAAAKHFWLHVDLDVLSTEAMSAIDYPQSGGLSWGDLGEITSRALAHPSCAGWSVVIYNPDLDTNQTGAHEIVRYIEDVLPARRGLPAGGRGGGAPRRRGARSAGGGAE
jgi:arginase